MEIATDRFTAKEILEGLIKDGVFYFRGSRTLHYDHTNGEIWYNYEGLHIRKFPDLQTAMDWFFGNDAQEAIANAKIIEYSYSGYLSRIFDAEVWLEEFGERNVSTEFSDYSNVDFTEEQLKIAREE